MEGSEDSPDLGVEPMLPVGRGAMGKLPAEEFPCGLPLSGGRWLFPPA